MTTTIPPRVAREESYILDDLTDTDFIPVVLPAQPTPTVTTATTPPAHVHVNSWLGWLRVIRAAIAWTFAGVIENVSRAWEARHGYRYAGRHRTYGSLLGRALSTAEAVPHQRAAAQTRREARERGTEADLPTHEAFISWVEDFLARTREHDTELRPGRHQLC